MSDLHPILGAVAAPRGFVFDCLTAFGSPSPVWRPGEEPQLIAQHDDVDGDVYEVRRRRRLAGRVGGVVERVRTHRGERIDIELVEGPLEQLEESLLLRQRGDGGTDIEYRGTLVLGATRSARLVERILAVPMHRREMHRELGRSRTVIEAAARAAGLCDAP